MAEMPEMQHYAEEIECDRVRTRFKQDLLTYPPLCRWIRTFEAIETNEVSGLSSNRYRRQCEPRLPCAFFEVASAQRSCATASTRAPTS